jgi:hypothetical protein
MAFLVLGVFTVVRETVGQLPERPKEGLYKMVQCPTTTNVSHRLKIMEC